MEAEGDATRGATASGRDQLHMLERVLRTLLTPLDHPDWGSWRTAAHGELLSLPGVDALGMHTPLTEDLSQWFIPHIDEGTLRTFAAELLPHDIVERRLAASGLGVAHQSQLVDRSTLQGTPLYAEFIGPQQLEDTTIALQDFGGSSPARLWFTGRSLRRWEPDGDRISLIRTVLPAFRAGLAMWQRVGAQRAELVRVFDQLRDPLLVYDLTGELLHANPAAVRLMETSGGPAVRAAAHEVAWAVGAMARRRKASSPEREVRSGPGVFRVRGSLAPDALLGSSSGVLVTIESESAKPLTDGELRERWKLTPREIATARLLGAGLTNREIAERLGVSFYTARNHVERVLARLGVPNRARVGALLGPDASR